jgi:hypothetical protein
VLLAFGQSFFKNRNVLFITEKNDRAFLVSIHNANNAFNNNLRTKPPEPGGSFAPV